MRATALRRCERVFNENRRGANHGRSPAPSFSSTVEQSRNGCSSRTVANESRAVRTCCLILTALASGDVRPFRAEEGTNALGRLSEGIVQEPKS
jgi:hypothetical protein